MRLARNAFRWAGWYGLIVLPPMFFLEARIGADLPPPITHPEFYYGFLGVTLSWQVAFLIIGSDPARFRPLMPAAILEKLGYAAIALVLFAQGRMALPLLAGGVADAIIGAVFVAAYRATREAGQGGQAG